MKKLNKEEINQYTRQLQIRNWDIASQIKLKNSNVVIAGVGGLGSPVALYLATAGVGNITIIDNDNIELSNLNRQILHTIENIGEQKVNSAFTKLSKYNKNIKINPINKKITSENTDKLFDNCDIIIDCLDNFKTRNEINKYAVNKKIPIVHGGVSSFNGQVTFIDTRETACLSCFLPIIDNEKSLPIVGAAAGVIGSIQAVEAIKYLTGIGENLKNEILFWDGLSMTFQKIKISKNPKCKICS